MKKTKRIAWLSLVLAVLMVVSVLPLGMLTASAATITATPNWYKSDSVLYVNNAADLWAFATALENGKKFAGQTVKLTADIEVNEGIEFYNYTGNGSNLAQWPLTTAGRTFAGIFDGQGHTISGLYVTGTGIGVGIFGNVATQTTATVKNVNIVNSYVTGSGNGGVGGIFGEVANETTTTVYDDSHINKTKAIVSGVYAEINVVCTASGKYDLGAGGIIGGTRSDVEITNTTFAGKVTSGVRGAAAFIGSAYPYFSSKAYYRNYVTIKNSVADAKIEGNAAESFAGALVGYLGVLTTSTFENVFSTCEVTGTTAAKLGVLVGGSTWNTDNYKKRDEVTEDWQEFFFNNVHYQTLGNIGKKIIGYDQGTKSAYKVCNDQYYAHATKAGVVDEIVDVVEGSLQQSLTLKNNLSLNVYATILDSNATVTIGGVEVDGNNGRYTLNDILPQQMTDTFTVKITQEILGETVVIRKNLSIYKYCEAFWEADFTTEAEKDLIADLLRYGAQAQLRKGYKTGFLATEGMDLGEYGSAVNVEDIHTQYDSEKHTGTDGYAFTNAALSLDNTLGLRLKFVAADTEGLTVSVAVNGKTQTFDANDFISSGDAYVVDYHRIYAHEMEAPVTAKLLKNGSAVATLTYSVADYCKAFLTDETQADYAVVKAMFAYGMSASAYNDDGRLVIIDGAESDYVIVYDDASATNKEIAWNFARKLRAKTGVMLPVKDDTTAKTSNEIIIGEANGRSDTATVYNEITAYDHKGARAKIVNSNIVLVAATDGLLQEMADNLLDEIRTHGGTTWGIGNDYSAQIDLPAYSTSGSSKVYYANENNHTLSVTNTNEEEYYKYINALIADGFEEYTTNEINGNLFGTYIKTAGGSNMVAYTAYYPDGSGYTSNEKTWYGTWKETYNFDTKETIGTNNQKITKANVRVTYGPLDFLLGKEEIKASEANVLVETPTITQPARWSSYMSASGMCYVIQLLDGRFILIDGGYASGSVTTYQKNGDAVEEAETKDYDDAKAIYDLLKEMSPDEKPVIAAWFLTHGHEDHAGLITAADGFLDRYHDQVEVEMIAYNDPNMGTATMGDGKTISCQPFVEKFDKYYSDVKHWVVHTGQKLYLPGCNVEIFFTPEDFYGVYDSYTFHEKSYSQGECYFKDGNQTSISFRITLGDTTFMVTGDSETENCTQMSTRYQDALRSDILQTPHHGLSGPELGFYEYVDPQTVFWTIDEFRMENDARCNGYTGTKDENLGDYIRHPDASPVSKGYGIGTNYYANGWLKTTQWERGEESGDRAIFAASVTTTIECSIPDGFKPKDPVIQTPIIPF